MTRIIAGIARGQRLRTLAGDVTRPTADRVRESFFSAVASWLGETGDQPLRGLGFADFYAGSGAVGLEAASRGASQVFLVESHRPAVTVIKENIAKLSNATMNHAQVKLLAGAAESISAQPATSACDVVWLDPPYSVENDRLEQVLNNLVENGWLVPDAMVCVERATRTQPFTWPSALENNWVRKYGETTLYYAQLG